MLTKKDFKAVTEIIKKRNEYCQGHHDCGAEMLGHDLADYFATQNSRFDRSRFMQACGLTE